MRYAILSSAIFSLMLISCNNQPQPKYPGASEMSDPGDVSIRLPDHVMPVLGCWFWIDEVLQAPQFKKFLDQVSSHSPYNLLTTSFRIPEKEITEDDFHQQIKLAAEYAREKGLSLVVDLDVRLARRAFQSAYPDELQEMVMLEELEFNGGEAIEGVVHSLDLNDHYTFRTTHYIPLKGSFLRAYSYVKTDEGILPNSLKDISSNCELVSVTKDSIQVRIPTNDEQVSSHVCIMVSFTHLAADVFAPHLIEFQRELIRSYADVPLAGACKDEWGFPPNYDGNPKKNQFWYSMHRAKAYADRTGGRELLGDLLLMHLSIEGKESERQMVINHFMEMSWQRNSELEDDFHNTVKEVFGPLAVSATHPTWWPYPDLNEYKKNGLHWWASTRDWAQTDEHTPYPVRTALSKKWGSPIWYNMYYADNKRNYETSIWSHALAGGRINYHPIYPNPSSLVDRDLELLKGDLMRAESRIRLLNYICHSPLDCPVAVIFGHACTMNWAGPSYDDVGLALADSLWRQGIPVDLIPSSEIGNNSLVIDEDGFIRYGQQRYAAVILYHPEFEKKSTAEFFNKAAEGRTGLFRMGDWTQEFNGQAYNWNEALPQAMIAIEEIPFIVSEVRQLLHEEAIQLQTPATGTLTYSTHVFIEPPTTGYCHLIDGTVIHLAGTKNVSGDLIQSTIKIEGQQVTFDAIGVAAARLNEEGKVEAMAAGGLKTFKAPGLAFSLDERTDIALWLNEKGKWEGVIQGWEGDVPQELLVLTKKWSRLGVPVPYPEQRTIK